MTSPIRILLVDDHDFLRRGLRALFDREKNCTVVGEAKTADEALDRIRERGADLVIMDILLPGKDGVSATTQIKAGWPQTKVLVLSGHSLGPASKGDVARALLAGADGFVAKQDGEECLLAAVAALQQGMNYLSPAATTELVASVRAAAATPREMPALTERETTVLKRMAEGASYKAIAAELGISAKSVDTLRTRLIRKLGLTSREDMVRYAITHGLIRGG
jgi:DNA-binding NarL/FixJ family response regulator